MWLLSTDRAELHSFSSPEAVSEGYVILSHVWLQEGEDTFQKLQELKKRSRQQSIGSFAEAFPSLLRRSTQQGESADFSKGFKA